MAEHGAPAEIVARARGKQAPRWIEVWEEHARVVEVFMAMDTQWRTVGVGLSGVMVEGLNYPSLRTVLWMLGFRLDGAERQALFADLKVMERAAVAALNE